MVLLHVNELPPRIYPQGAVEKLVHVPHHHVPPPASPELTAEATLFSARSPEKSRV